MIEMASSSYNCSNYFFIRYSADTVEALVNGIDDCVGGIARTHEEFAEAAAKFASTSKVNHKKSCGS